MPQGKEWRDRTESEQYEHRQALLKRCRAFIEYQVDHHQRKDSGDWAELDLTEASILLVDLQEVTR